ncbi:hypothetical protein [Helicobacter sp. 10-6591]|uniref:hypothetical protein n=1 Tax=Helicobacter sp. 10-6591 TaxID=2004998 RepID=UPI000DCE1DF5|nr:hypothetical protein [Helicobacter sp. 10-6591]MCI7484333.1 hypothetical protein [Helicobacter sp.]RAX55473.1 hypothetical protein CCY97_04195 [Helicobacter sp. 10-6591]
MEDDVRFDRMLKETMRFFHFLMPRDQDIFVRKLMEELREAKESEITPEEREKELSNFLEKFQEETKDLKNELEVREHIDSLSDEIKDIQKETEQQTEEKTKVPTQETQQEISAPQENKTLDSTELDNQTITLANDISLVDSLSERKKGFELMLNDKILDFVAKNEEELRELGIYKDNENAPPSYEKEYFVTEEQTRNLQNEFNKTGALNFTLDMESVRARVNESKSFMASLEDEVAQTLNVSKKAKSLADTQKINTNTYFSDLLDWFEKKRIENNEMPMTKDKFKEEFLDYCKNGMGENEIKVLLILSHKEPSKLSGEHKEMIKQGLKYNLQNNKLLDKGLEATIRANVGNKVGNNSIADITKSTEKMRLSNNPLDKKLLETSVPKIAQSLKNQKDSNKLTPESLQKLNNLIQNKAPSITKDVGKSL